MEKTFSEILREKRTALSLSQTQCAELLDIPFRTYCDWERGVTSPPVIAQEGALKRLEDRKP